MTDTRAALRRSRTLTRGRTKRVAAAVLALGLVALTSGLLVMSGQVTLQTSTGAAVSSGLNEVATVPANADQLVNWLPDAWPDEREMEPASRTRIAASYIRAWAAIGRFQSTGETPAVIDTFSGAARRAVLELPSTGPSATWDLRHSLELEFYSLDGATVAFQDQGARIARTVGTGESETVILSQETYDVVMVLEDGFWRIRQLKRALGSDDVTVTTAAAGAATITGATPRAPLPIPSSRATEYRPDGWEARDPAELAADFTRLRALGFDTIRVPLSFTDLGGTRPTDDAIDGVTTLLEQADAHGLRVALVLFDDFPDLTPATWVGAGAHLTRIATAVRGQPALVLWDLADRPDLRTSGPTSAAEIRAFLVYAGSALREIDPETPQTISWATSATAADPAMAGLVDGVTLHLTGNEDPAGAIQAVRTAVPDRPVLLTVTGLDTDGGWSPLPRTEARQVVDVDRVLQAGERAGLSRVSVATFIDTETDAGGLLRRDASAKPAAALFAASAEPAAVSPPGVLDYARSKFWILMTALFAAAASVLLWVRRRKHTAPARPKTSSEADGD
ncbi:hypothetical protein [Cryobacterium cryoconiti]|uniref:Glycosyl hydrolase family 5 n=1 Tax=Cryobacterium cryoconiti TaxID=1259239 RepID=A0A4Y8JX85_9MICO|nr:hypothetical protein [Cryobacterium cryoconiti]TFD30674.1 hypothetical protein E3T49_07385 [Cryobacterium cryoconiti]